MSYTSLSYFLLVLTVFCVYYTVPLSCRRYVLLAGSMVFYRLLNGTVFFFLFLSTIVLTWLFGRILEKNKSRALLVGMILLVLLPMVIGRFSWYSEYLRYRYVLPVGISFYSLQIIAYLADIYRKKYPAEQNILRFALFISWFPQIIQGPIPRYDALSHQLEEGHRYDPQAVKTGLWMILWGLFLKLVIADRAAVFTDTVFNGYESFTALMYWLAAVLYSMQIYADFLSCVMISTGVSRLFGIHLAKNFDHPYAADTVQDFWRRWHISLSTWLRDYVYIPLGGSRKGKTRRYINLVITFAVSGLWHGAGLRFLAWGLMHAIWQITEDLIRVRSRVFTWFRLVLSWVLFRAVHLRAALYMYINMFMRLHMPVFSDIQSGGLDAKDLTVLGISVCLWGLVSRLQYREELPGKYAQIPDAVRLFVSGLLITVIWVFGMYGTGFSAKDFIYGAF